MILTATLKKHSVCSCGFPALNEQIQRGTRYQVDTSTIALRGFTWTCGGCRKTWQLATVHASQVLHPEQPRAPFPLELLLPIDVLEHDYRLVMAGETVQITCLKCGSISSNPHDVECRYCGRCKVFHEDQTEKGITQ